MLKAKKFSFTLICVLLVSVLVFAFDAYAAPKKTTFSNATVAWVYDGNTLKLTDGRMVKLLQVQTPEIRYNECYSLAALMKVRGILQPGTKIRLESDPYLRNKDRFGRLLRYVHVRGINLNYYMVRQGIAMPDLKSGHGKYFGILHSATMDAYFGHKGLWRNCL